MFGSSIARSAFILTVVMAGCTFKGMGQPNGDAGNPSGSGGGAGTSVSTGRGGAPVIIVDGGGGGGGMAMGTLDANCGTKTQTAQMLPPDIMLVMDRSLSMTNDVDDKTCAGAMGNNGNCGPNSKWELMIPAINGAVTATDAIVNWGMYYLGDEPGPNCGVAAAPVVPIAMTGANAVTTALAANTFTGGLGTPTRRVIQNAVTYLTGLTDPNPKYILLATDGQPNCPTTNANSLNTDDSTGTVDAVTAALAMGIPTFVVGIGNTGAMAALNNTAVAGGRPQMGGTTSYYQVNDAAALTTALSTIVGQAASCTFNIGAAPLGTSAVGLGVFGDGSKLTMDPTNGWSFKDATMTTIVLNGSLCEQVTSGAIKSVTVAFVCVPI
jgi:hypothetical protein